MTRSEFRELLASARPQAVRMVMKRQVAQWFEGGATDVTEGISKWIDRRLDLGEDSVLIDLAIALDLVES